LEELLSVGLRLLLVELFKVLAVGADVEGGVTVIGGCGLFVVVRAVGGEGDGDWFALGWAAEGFD
jgi:hypothetical protein